MTKRIFSLFQTWFVLPVACKNQFQNWFLQAKHRSLSNLIFTTWFFKNHVQINRGGWVKKIPKIWWRNIGMVPNAETKQCRSRILFSRLWNYYYFMIIFLYDLPLREISLEKGSQPRPEKISHWMIVVIVIIAQPMCFDEIFFVYILDFRFRWINLRPILLGNFFVKSIRFKKMIHNLFYKVI